MHINLKFENDDGDVNSTIFIQGDTMSFNWPGMFAPVKFQFPLTKGKSWVGEGLADTFHVSIENVSVPKGLYISATKVEGSLSGFDDALDIKTWLWHNKGILKLELNQFSMINNFHQTWELISYNEFEIDDFEIYDYPLTVGNYWYYQVHNKLENRYYDVKAEIVYYGSLTGSLTDSINGYLMEYEYPDHYDTVFIYPNGDTLNFVSVGRINVTNNTIVFPLEVGNTWTTYPFDTQNRVVSKDFIETQAGNFHKAYQIEDWYWCGDECGHIEHSWYSRTVGLVYRDRYMSEYYIGGDSTVVHFDETWDLKSYYILLPQPADADK